MTELYPNIGKILHIRSLNYLRREHLLTYVGARILAENIQPAIFDEWTTQFLLRRTKTGRQPVYWQHWLFKSLGLKGNPEFRKCLVGSPTTHLHEVWVLWKLSQDAAFAPGPSVYSYLWPNPSSLHVFRHFMKGYRDRERAIAAAAESLTSPFVVVLDLKRFYPSIDTAIALQRFRNRIEASAIKGDEAAAILECAAVVCRKRKIPGLPIGPPLSHVLANVYLENVDRFLEQAYPGRFFRYVDDIAIVVEQLHIGQVIADVAGILDPEGLVINEDKTDIHSAKLWKAHVADRDAAQPPVTFAELVSKLSQYLAHQPEGFGELHTRFREAGFSLPFTNAKSIAEYGPFRNFAKRLLRRMGIARIAGSIKPEELLRNAFTLRTHFTIRAKEVASHGIAEVGIQRRWDIQNYRFVFNRLPYLIRHHELADYLEWLPDIDELVQTRELFKALIAGDITGLIHYPGPTVTAFAQLWSETQDSEPEIQWSEKPKSHERDAVITLAQYELCKPPSEWMANFAANPDYNRTALNLAVDPNPAGRTHKDFSYIDELESLFLTPGIDQRALLNSRFDNDEDIVLPALSIGTSSDGETESGY